MSRRGAIPRRRRDSGRRRIPIALGLLVLAVMAPVARAAAQPTASAYGQDGEPRARSAPTRGQKVYDALVLRPFGVVHTVVSAAMFVVFYPAALATGTSDDLTDMCITGPVEQTFKKPLGEP